MLVLSRMPNEQIVITCPNGEVITFTMIEVRGNKARLGVDAPSSYAVHRAEVQRKIELQQAAG